MSGLGLLALGASPAVANDLIDARQQTQIWTTFALNPLLGACDLTVTVRDGRAVLRGAADDEVDRELAEQLALGVAGVVAVDNQVTIVPPGATRGAATGRRYGEAVEDATTTSMVKAKLAWSRHADGLRVQVLTEAGRVTLSGTADSAASRDFAGVTAQHTRGVNFVENRTTVAPAPPGRRGEVDDAWITARVRSTLRYSSKVEAEHLTIGTESGVVTLRGRLESGAERALVVELSGHVRGVRRVDADALTVRAAPPTPR